MAETKARGRAKKANPKARSKQRPKAKPRSASKPKARSAAKARKRPASKTRPGSTGKPRSSNGSKPKAGGKAAIGKSQEVAGNVGDAARDAGGAVKGAGGAVGRAESKTKVPLMAGCAAQAGAAGGIALGTRQAHRHRGLAGIDSDDLVKAAKKVGDVGVQVGELAFEARRAREASNGRHRSPIEVVLQGLTSRGARR